MKDIDSEILQAFRDLSDEQRRIILDSLAPATVPAASSFDRP